jgi:hypothetical protein
MAVQQRYVEEILDTSYKNKKAWIILPKPFIQKS